MVIHILKENGHVTDGRTLDECLAFLPNGGYVAEVVTKEQWEKRKPRTLNQNALLHVWCRHIAKALTEYSGDERWSGDEVKRFFAYLFGEDRLSPDGTPYRAAVETHKMTKRQMTEYMEKIQAYVASECGITVPLPDDEKYKEFTEIYG